MNVRQFLGKADTHFRVEWAKEYLKDHAQVKRLLKILRAEGFIKPSEEQGWDYEITEMGRSFARSTAARPITRATAEKTVTELLHRVELVNKDKRFIRSVEAVVVFGSYLTDKERLNDVDVAIKLKDRWPENMSEEERDKRNWNHIALSGRRFSNITEEIAWPEREVELYLRNRVRSLSLQDWNTFVRMVCEWPGNFQYRILVGDEKRLVKELAGHRAAHENPAS